MSRPAGWSDSSGIARAVRRRWDDGSLLRAWANGEPFPVIEVPLRGPSAADLGEHFDDARRWVTALTRDARGGRAYELRHGRIGGRLSGRTEVPVCAVIGDYAQAWRLLQTADEAEGFRSLISDSATEPAARSWALANPHRAIRLAASWPTLLTAYRWLDDHRESGLYLRQVDAPGVDTKFIEQNRSVLAAILGVSAGAAAFTGDLGLATKPATVRLRFDPIVFGLPEGLSEASFRINELSAMRVGPERALIVENEVTYLSVPIPARGVVLWGRGYDVDRPASLSWLADVPVLYWGDLDTHGFGILNRLRTWLPHAVSVLMDRDTLLEHRERWVTEPTPTNAALARLTTTEQSVYEDLVTDRFGHAVRLEQERIDWRWVLGRLD